jgi:hypothetical protein
MRASTQKARGSFQECARAFAYSASGSRIARERFSVHAGIPQQSHRDRRLHVRLRLIRSDDSVRPARIKLETRCARQGGERFWGSRALILKIQRVPNPAYIWVPVMRKAGVRYRRRYQTRHT